MSWKLTKKLKDATLSSSKLSSSSSSATHSSSTPAPVSSDTAASPQPSSSSASVANPASGQLIIHVLDGKNIQLPPDVSLPATIEKALASKSSPAVVGSPVANSGQGKNRENLQRRQCWWLPYILLEFDKNQVLIDAVGGDIRHPVWAYKGAFDVSRASEITMSLYLRTSEVVVENGQGRNDMGNDMYLSGIKFTPVFDPHRATNEWYTANTGTGSLHVQTVFKPALNQSLSIDAFDLLKVIGKGSFGKVMQVRKKDTSRIYALKTIRKAHIVSRSEVTHTLAERTVLAKVNNPFIVPLKFSFQNQEKLYLVLAFVNGGELFHHLQREGKFSEQRSRFYAAELLSALEHLHSFNVIYRDLKPENILLDYTGHIALCDFGLCKLNMTESETTNTFCGTPEYLACEILLGQPYSKQIDWWTLGILLYEMLTGLPPFYDENVNEMYKKILQAPLKFPEDMGSDAKSLLTGLLSRDPSQRLGVNGAEEIKKHPFFAKHIDWSLLLQKKIHPPFKPQVSSVADTSNFDAEFTAEPAMDSVVEDSHLSQTVQKQFQGFSYFGRDGLDTIGESLR